MTLAQDTWHRPLASWHCSPTGSGTDMRPSRPGRLAQDGALDSHRCRGAGDAVAASVTGTVGGRECPPRLASSWRPSLTCGGLYASGLLTMGAVLGGGASGEIRTSGHDSRQHVNVQRRPQEPLERFPGSLVGDQSKPPGSGPSLQGGARRSTSLTRGPRWHGRAGRSLIAGSPQRVEPPYERGVLGSAISRDLTSVT